MLWTYRRTDFGTNEWMMTDWLNEWISSSMNCCFGAVRECRAWEPNSQSMNNVIGMVALFMPFISNCIFVRTLLNVFNVHWGFWMAVFHTAFRIHAVVSAGKSMSSVEYRLVSVISTETLDYVSCKVFCFCVSAGGVTVNERSLWKVLKTCEIGWLWSRYSAASDWY